MALTATTYKAELAISDMDRHYYATHGQINPTGIVPLGPDPSGWDTPHGRDGLVSGT